MTSVFARLSHASVGRRQHCRKLDEIFQITSATISHTRFKIDVFSFAWSRVPCLLFYLTELNLIMYIVRSIIITA